MGKYRIPGVPVRNIIKGKTVKAVIAASKRAKVPPAKGKSTVVKRLVRVRPLPPAPCLTIEGALQSLDSARVRIGGHCCLVLAMADGTYREVVGLEVCQTNEEKHVAIRTREVAKPKALPRARGGKL